MYRYIGASDRAKMLAERSRVEQALEQVFGRMRLAVKRAPTEHAGGKWRLSYTTALGRPGHLEVGVNFMLRTPLWPVAPRDSHAIGGQTAARVLVLDEHDLAAGKLAALVARSASRDLFDASELLRRTGLDRAKLRLGFVVYGGANREDWRSVGVEVKSTLDVAGPVQGSAGELSSSEGRYGGIMSWQEGQICAKCSDRSWQTDFPVCPRR